MPPQRWRVIGEDNVHLWSPHTCMSTQTHTYDERAYWIIMERYNIFHHSTKQGHTPATQSKAFSLMSTVTVLIIPLEQALWSIGAGWPAWFYFHHSVPIGEDLVLYGMKCHTVMGSRGFCYFQLCALSSACMSQEQLICQATTWLVFPCLLCKLYYEAHVPSSYGDPQSSAL